MKLWGWTDAYVGSALERIYQSVQPLQEGLHPLRSAGDLPRCEAITPASETRSPSVPLRPASRARQTPPIAQAVEGFKLADDTGVDEQVESTRGHGAGIGAFRQFEEYDSELRVRLGLEPVEMGMQELKGVAHILSGGTREGRAGEVQERNMRTDPIQNFKGLRSPSATERVTRSSILEAIESVRADKS